MPSIFNEKDVSEQVKRAEDWLAVVDYQQAILAYQQIQPQSPRILHRIGILYGEKIGDYHSAMSCFERALEMQDEVNGLTSDLFSSIALIHQNCREFDLALIYHQRALQIRQTISPIDHQSIATSLFGIANAYWGQENLSDALHYAQQALTLNESVQTDNEMNIATNSAILANIYHQCGDDIRALELAQRALTLLETCVSSDSPSLAPLLNNIGTIQISMNLFNDALLTFIRVLHICEKTLPEDHPKRISICNNIQRATEMQQFNQIHSSCSYLWHCLSKILLF